LEEAKDFCRGCQQEVAKIVQCGEKIEEEASCKGGLKFFAASPVSYSKKLYSSWIYIETAFPSFIAGTNSIFRAASIACTVNP